MTGNQNTATKDKVITCLAAVCWGTNQELSIEEIQIHPPQKGEVRIKILYCGICHSDIHAMKGEISGNQYPVILGHEGAGIVESIGEGVTSVAPGDSVVCLMIPQCRECRWCKDPTANLCDDFRGTFALESDGSSRMTCKGQKLYRFLGVSAFSQYLVTSEYSCVKIKKEAPLDKVCLLGCGVPTGYGAALNTAKVTPGSTCAVWGLGTVGLAAVMGCRENGATRIIGIDTNDGKKDIAKKFGVTDFINPRDLKEPIHEVIQKMVEGGMGCDFTFECIGNAEAVMSAFKSIRARGGICVMLGLCPPDKPLMLDGEDFVFQKTLTGVAFGGYKTRDAIPRLVDDYLDKKLLLDEFVTGTIKLKDINEGIDKLLAGKALRTIVELF